MFKANIISWVIIRPGFACHNSIQKMNPMKASVSKWGTSSWGTQGRGQHGVRSCHMEYTIDGWSELQPWRHAMVMHVLPWLEFAP